MWIELWIWGGEPAAAAFSTLARLVDTLGGAQPWMLMETERLQGFLATAGVRRVLLDPDLGAPPGRWEMEELQRLEAGPVGPGRGGEAERRPLVTGSDARTVSRRGQAAGNAPFSDIDRGGHASPPRARDLLRPRP